MDPHNVPGPSGVKKRRVVTLKDPEKLSEGEMAAYLDISDDSSDDVSTDNELYDISQDDESDLENDPGSNLLDTNVSTSNNIVWSDPPLINRQQLLFDERTGLQQIPIGDTPISYFNLLVDDNFYNLIIEQTNIYAEEVFLSSGRERPRISEWSTLTKDELRVFLGLLLHMGTIRINRLQDYWKTHRLFNLTCFSNCMGRNRFLLILRCLHFEKNPIGGEDIPNDRLYKIRPIINYFNEKMLQVYCPSKELSLDESMISWRRRLNFRQYLPGERHKYGIKCYVLAEPNGLTLKLMIYSAAKDMTSGSGHTSTVVLHLMQERLDKGHALFMDNFYNSHSLASTLIKRKTYCTGTIRANRKGNSTDVIKQKLRRGEVIVKCDEENGIVMAKWHDKRDVTFISTEYSANLEEVQNKRGTTKLKPEAIVAYNKFMSGVDRKDQMLAYNACDRKTLRWYKKAAIHTLQILLLNSWFLYNKYATNKMSFYDFRLIIIEDLMTQKGTTISAKSSKATENIHLPSELPKSGGKVQRKDCRICRNKTKIRKITNYCCNLCPGNPGLCLEPCFKIWHEK